MSFLFEKSLIIFQIDSSFLPGSRTERSDQGWLSCVQARALHTQPLKFKHGKMSHILKLPTENAPGKQKKN